jgi:uncharacterized protein YfiM (DUF2279 family)
MCRYILPLCLAVATIAGQSVETTDDTTSAQYDTLSIMPEMRKQISDPWFGQDKLLHFSAGFAIPGLTYHFYVCRLNGDEDRGKVYAVSLTALLAFGKEIYDKQEKGHFSWKDLAWGGLGLAAGYLVFVH